MTLCDVVISAGQSNAVGRGDSSLSPTAPVTALEWEGSSTLAALVDPVGTPSPYNAQTGSMWPAFASALIGRTGRPCIIIPTAVGGTALLPGAGGNWAAGGSTYNNFATRANSGLADIATAGYEPATVSIAWHQGESDAANYSGTTAELQAAYAAALPDLFTRAKTSLSLPSLRFFVWGLGDRPGYEAKHAAVIAAQQSACSSTDGMTLVYAKCPDFFSLGWMKADNLHYNQAGLNDMGTVGGLAVATALGFPGEAPVAGRRNSRTAERMFLL